MFLYLMLMKTLDCFCRRAETMTLFEDFGCRGATGGGRLGRAPPPAFAEEMSFNRAQHVLHLD